MIRKFIIMNNKTGEMLKYLNISEDNKYYQMHCNDFKKKCYFLFYFEGIDAIIVDCNSGNVLYSPKNEQQLLKEQEEKRKEIKRLEKEKEKREEMLKKGKEEKEERLKELKEDMKIYLLLFLMFIIWNGFAILTNDKAFGIIGNCWVGGLLVYYLSSRI